MDKLTAEWCLREARVCRETSLAFSGADKRAGFGDGYERHAAALTIAARVLDEDGLAAALVEADEFYDDPKVAAQNTGWGSRIIAAGHDKPHDGDCTRAPYSCFRCTTDEYRAKARAVLAYLKGEVE